MTHCDILSHISVNLHQLFFIYSITDIKYGYQVPGIRYQVSGIRYQVSGIRYQVSGIRYQVSGIRYQVSGIRYQVSDNNQSDYERIEIKT
jgi:hypothetical protein